VPFDLTYASNRLPPKQRILGIELDSIYGAMLIDAVKEECVLNQTLGVNKLVGLYDRELDRIRVFNRKLEDGTILEFAFFENKYVDNNSKSEWNSDGECVYGRYRGRQLAPILAIDSMWFAWYAFHPDTQILGKESRAPVRGPIIPYN
jgi:hypothetical protein